MVEAFLGCREDPDSMWRESRSSDLHPYLEWLSVEAFISQARCPYPGLQFNFMAEASNGLRDFNREIPIVFYVSAWRLALDIAG